MDDKDLPMCGHKATVIFLWFWRWDFLITGDDGQVLKFWVASPGGVSEFVVEKGDATWHVWSRAMWTSGPKKGQHIGYPILFERILDKAMSRIVRAARCEAIDRPSIASRPVAEKSVRRVSDIYRRWK